VEEGKRMPGVGRVSLSEGSVRGLAYMHTYRFLTIPQFARISGVSYKHASEVLMSLERLEAVGFIGYQSIPGKGKTPKLYYLKRRGFAFLSEAADVPGIEVKAFRETHKDLVWSPATSHRIRIIDCILALERSVLTRPQLTLQKILLEYRRARGSAERETTDYVAEPRIPDTRIVPDGVFVLANRESGRRGLFFLEVDMGSERITSPVSRDPRATIRGKFEQYDKYLTSGRFVETYAAYGEFRFFSLLFVTTSPVPPHNASSGRGAFPRSHLEKPGHT
jgi:hypothetical protein